MQTRNRSKRREEDPTETAGDSGSHSTSVARSQQEEGGSLAAVSKEAVGRLLKRAKGRKGSRNSTGESKDSKQEQLRENSKWNEEHTRDFSVRECLSGVAEKSMSNKEVLGGADRWDANDMDWEDGTVTVSEFKEAYSHDLGRDVTVEFTESPGCGQRKPPRRASAEDKELAELAHKVHLLCLVARGRLVDSACNDPLIQASLFSLLPSYMLKIVEIPRLKANMLGSLVNWFQDNFHVRSQSIDRGSFNSNLAYALETREGTPEEVAALSVALFRALNLSTRFVSVLDVVSLKPDADMAGSSNQNTSRLDTRIFSSAAMVASPNHDHAPHLAQSSDTTKEETAHKISRKEKLRKKENSPIWRKNLLTGLDATSQSDDRASQATGTKACSYNLDSFSSKSAEGPKRKGDLEFELQLEMALSATAAGPDDIKLVSESDRLHSSSSSPAPALKKMRTIEIEDSSFPTHDSSSAVWSRKNGPPLYWAEVYCSGETLNGRWVHIDAANGIVNGEEKVESAAAACRRPLRYVLAFAGNGAKDVTRRYCKQWYKIASRRVNLQWWDTMLAPLKELEARATSGTVHVEAFQENAASDVEKRNSEVPHPLETDSYPASSSVSQAGDDLGGDLIIGATKQTVKANVPDSSTEHPMFPCRDSLEDMELETRALTEPLPTNQLAYKNHHLYAIERWLTKHQILHPKGPILGYCSGHPVYPRSCVQSLQTKHRWLREGFQVKANEVPAKVVKRSKTSRNAQISEPGNADEDDGGSTVELYGKWQLELLQLPHAVNGIVPKNERGQVDVWSEKCLPPGTTHLRFPRLASIARRLDIDFAPAMVGFDFRNGRSVPVFEGIVVCTEFRDAILEAYEEEEERREAEERKRDEAQALSRWFQLLSSIVTRQRLENSYVDSSSLNSPQEPSNNQKNDRSVVQNCRSDVTDLSRDQTQRSVQDSRPVFPSADDHEHFFPAENQSFDEDSMVRTKRCSCGFSIQVEEL